MKVLTYFCVIFTFYVKLNVSLAAKFPPGFEFCHRSDPKLSQCIGEQMTKALVLFKDGSPELGIPKLQPFSIPKLEILGVPSPTVTLNQKYENMSTYGIPGSSVYEPRIKIDEKECYFDFMVLTQVLSMEAMYEIKGQLLMFPINGHGRCNITIVQLRNHHMVQCEIYQKKGKPFMKYTDYKMDLQGDEVIFDFENIMPGNPQLSEELRKTLNENSQEIFKDVKHGFETVWSQLHMQTANNVLAKFPLDELFPKQK